MNLIDFFPSAPFLLHRCWKAYVPGVVWEAWPTRRPELFGVRGREKRKGEDRTRGLSCCPEIESFLRFPVCAQRESAHSVLLPTISNIWTRSALQRATTRAFRSFLPFFYTSATATAAAAAATAAQMGAFLDKPKTDKHYESGSGNGLRYALCSMQGWRIDMEDAQ